MDDIWVAATTGTGRILISSMPWDEDVVMKMVAVNPQNIYFFASLTMEGV